jgi:hypothetical protein
MLKPIHPAALCLAIALTASAQDLSFPDSSAKDTSRLPVAMAALAQQAVAIYKVEDQEKYLDNLFRLQLLPGMQKITQLSHRVQGVCIMAGASYIQDRSQRHLLAPGQRQRFDFESIRLMSRLLQAGAAWWQSSASSRHPTGRLTTEPAKT